VKTEPAASQTTADAELRRLLPQADNQAALMGGQIVLSEWKLRAFGVSNAMIQTLKATRKVGA
jgi:hypothetical protein